MSEQFWVENRKCFISDKQQANVIDPYSEVTAGMYVECVHPITKTTIHAALIEEVFETRQARIRIDSETTFIWSFNDLGVMPIGTCLSMRVYLEPPFDFEKSDFLSGNFLGHQADRGEPPEEMFSWRLYSKRKDNEIKTCQVAPREDLKELTRQFPIGGKLELLVPGSSEFHCGTVCKASNGLLFVHIDSWPPHSPNLILPVDSENIFPVNFAESQNKKVIPPYGFQKDYSHVEFAHDLQSIFINARCHLGSRFIVRKALELDVNTPESRSHLFWQTFLARLIACCTHITGFRNALELRDGRNDARRIRDPTPTEAPPPWDAGAVKLRTKYPKTDSFISLVPLKRELVDTYLLRLAVEVFETCPLFLTVEKGRSPICPKKCYLGYRKGRLGKQLEADLSFIRRLGKSGRADASSSSSRSTSSNNGLNEDGAQDDSPPVHRMTTRGKRAASYADLSGKRPRRQRDSGPGGNGNGNGNGNIPVEQPTVPEAKTETQSNSPKEAPREATFEGSASSASVEEFLERRGEIPPTLNSDIRQWSMEHVVEYAVYNGHTELTSMLRQEHFDGKAVLLFNAHMSAGINPSLKDMKAPLIKFAVEVTSVHYRTNSPSPRALPFRASPSKLTVIPPQVGVSGST